MGKLESALSRFLGGNDGLFSGGVLLIVVLVFLVIGTDLLDDFFDDDNIWVWIILIALLLFNFDDSYC